MTKRILSTALFIITIGTTIWQLTTQGSCWLIAILATLSGLLLIITIFPIFRWGCHMIKNLWKAWRHPDNFLYIWNLSNVSLLPHPSDPGRGFEWICGFEVVSFFPWQKIVCFELEIREPSELAGTKGCLRNIEIKALSSTDIGAHRYPMSNQVHDFLVARIKKTPSFQPIRILVNGKDNKDRHLLNQSLNYVVQW